MNSYLFLDTETGGLDPRRHSLLSLGLVAGDADGIAESLEILLRHETYGVTGGGMKVNRIDIAGHHARALDPAAALNEIDGFLSRHFAADTAIILVGHNIAFDRAFLGAFLEGQGRALEPRFSHRSIDTHSIAAALQEAGRIPAEAVLNSTGLFAHFDIHVPEAQRHTALGDAVATFQLYWKLVEVAR